MEQNNCKSCGALKNIIYEHCYNCKQNKDKPVCKGFKNDVCENKTITQRCISHTLTKCFGKSDGPVKTIEQHLNDKCCDPKYCGRCKAINFTKYKYCYNCSQSYFTKPKQPTELVCDPEAPTQQ